MANAVAEERVRVKCLGINQVMGFNIWPSGEQPSYVEFVPGQYTEVRKSIATELVKRDSTKFIVEEKIVEKKADNAPKAQKKEKRRR